MSVLTVVELGLPRVSTLLSPFGLSVVMVDADSDIPGSHWGDSEAGLIQNTLFVRADTPVHSAMHEACHWLLMSESRREVLHTNAGGTMMEENAVCYLQIELADCIEGMGRLRMLRDMDEWGYSFRLGSAQRWFEKDAEDAREFLEQHELVLSGKLALSRIGV